MKCEQGAIFAEIERAWQRKPHEAMVVSQDESFTFYQLSQAVNACSTQLKRWDIQSVALLADNSWSWLVVDLACQKMGIVLLPLPLFFSAEQIVNSVQSVGCDLLLTDSVLSAMPDVDNSLIKAKMSSTEFSHLGFAAYALTNIKYSAKAERLIDKNMPNYTSKITFTSGTTGKPKGVCLSEENQFLVAKSIAERFSSKENKHLAILPLATLLENIAGLYAPLFNGAMLYLPSLKKLGFTGSSQLNFQRLLKNITDISPSSLIITPEILKGLVLFAQQGWQVPRSLIFVAVGGAHVAAELLTAAHACGIPAYQGYGLSECGSVVSLNYANDNKVNSTGKALAHLTLAIENGELIVTGNSFLGYLSQPETWGQKRYATGDLAQIDPQGYLYITGRKKNVLISSFGRNISPEWLEEKLLANAAIHQAYVFGDAQPFCCVGIYPFCGSSALSEQSTERQAMIKQQVDMYIQQINQTLPDYAQLKSWFLLTEPLTVMSGLLTANGRAKREKVTAHFSKQLTEIYQ
jgi:long-subunit acyl-CoA synthetase (AMP-forming)